MITIATNLLIINFVTIFRQREWLVQLFKKYIKPFLTWRILIIYLPIWFIVSGWSMVGIAIGHGWFRRISMSWQTFLWTPICPEKFFTIPLTIYLHKKIFPKHSVASLEEVLEREKQEYNEKKRKRLFKNKNKRSSKDEN